MKVYDALGQPIPVDGAVPATNVIQVTADASAVPGSVAIAGTGVGTAAVWIDVNGLVQFQAYDLGNLPMGPAVTVNAVSIDVTDVAIGSQSIEAGALPGMRQSRLRSHGSITAPSWCSAMASRSTLLASKVPP